MSKQALQHKTQRIRELNDENSQLKAALAQREAAHAEMRHRENCRAVVLVRASETRLDPTETKRLENVVENKRRAWIAAGNPRTSFPIYEVIRDHLASKGHGVPLHKADAPMPLSPASTGGLPLTEAERATADAERERQRARGERLVEENRKSAEAYRATLARLGLAHPTDPIPGNGSGFGY